MIIINGKEITAINLGKKAVNAVYKGSVLIWQAIRSCFGLGYWDDDKPWLDEDAWQDETFKGKKVKKVKR